VPPPGLYCCKPMLLFTINPPSEHELYLKLFITCGGGL
jgi:hypothetical protein